MGKRRISEKSSVAIVCAIVWVMFVLCFSVPFRPAEKAHAATMDDVIEVWANDPEIQTGGDSHEDFMWGTFYRGMSLLETARYRVDGEEGELSWIDVDDPYDPQIALDIPDQRSALFLMGSGHTHDFTEEEGSAGGTEWTPIDEYSHWAVCECGFELQVAHRLDGAGGCKDCSGKNEEGNEVLEDLANYTNTYEFTDIPDYITNTPEEVSGDIVVEFDDNGVAEFSIGFNANLVLGYTLALNLACDSGALADGDKKIYYTIEVDADYGEAGSFEPGSSEPQPIWTYSATEENVSVDGDGIMAKISGSITITLTLDLEALYSGNFSDTLTFSATLTEGENE